MSTAIALRNVVGEAQHMLMIAVVPPHGGFDRDAVTLGPHVDRLLDQRMFGTVQIAHERFQATFVEQLLDLVLNAALVRQDDADAGVQEGQLAQPVFKRAEIELGLGEGFR